MFIYKNHMKYYIRFGEIPEHEQSIKYNSESKEIGVSVYDAIEMTDGWHVIIPLPFSLSQGATYNHLINNDRCIYLVTGNEVGIGMDNEPLLKNVKILKDITYEKEQFK